jgi:hypothetical protein
VTGNSRGTDRTPRLILRNEVVVTPDRSSGRRDFAASSVNYRRPRPSIAGHGIGPRVARRSRPHFRKASQRSFRSVNSAARNDCATSRPVHNIGDELAGFEVVVFVDLDVESTNFPSRTCQCARQNETFCLWTLASFVRDKVLADFNRNLMQAASLTVHRDRVIRRIGHTAGRVVADNKPRSRFNSTIGDARNADRDCIARQHARAAPRP